MEIKRRQRRKLARKIQLSVAALTDVERGWLGGIYDGDGCLTVRCANGSDFSVHVEVNMTHRPTIERVSSLLGINSFTSLTPTQPRRKPIYRVIVGGENAIGLVKALRPYLFTKARVADLIIEYSSTMRDPDGSPYMSGGVPREVWEKRRVIHTVITQRAKLIPAHNFDKWQWERNS